MKKEIIIKAAISIAWITLWSTPVLVCLCSDSILLVLIGIMWAVIMHAFTKAYAPKWILTAWEAVFPAEREMDAEPAEKPAEAKENENKAEA